MVLSNFGLWGALSYPLKVAPRGPKGLIIKKLIMEGLRIAPQIFSKVTLCGFKQLWTYNCPPYCLAPLCNGCFTLKDKRVKVTRSDAEMLGADIYAVRCPNDCYNCYWQLLPEAEEKFVAAALGGIAYKSIGKNNIALFV